MIVHCAFCKKDGAFGFTGAALEQDYWMVACLPCALEKRMELEEEVRARAEDRAFRAELADAEANAEGWASLIKLLGSLALIAFAVWLFFHVPLWAFVIIVLLWLILISR